MVDYTHICILARLRLAATKYMKVPLPEPRVPSRATCYYFVIFDGSAKDLYNRTQKRDGSKRHLQAIRQNKDRVSPDHHMCVRPTLLIHLKTENISAAHHRSCLPAFTLGGGEGHEPHRREVKATSSPSRSPHETLSAPWLAGRHRD